MTRPYLQHRHPALEAPGWSNKQRSEGRREKVAFRGLKGKAFKNLFTPTKALTFRVRHKWRWAVLRYITCREVTLSLFSVVWPHTVTLHCVNSFRTQKLRCFMTGRVLSLWSPHSWTDTCLFHLHPSALTDNFQTVRSSMFSPVKKKTKQEADSSQKNK